MARRFVYEDEKSHKFWTVEVDDRVVTVHFGRIGTRGQVQVTEYGSPTAARTAADTLIYQKLGKGYSEEDDEAVIPPPFAARPSPAPRARPAVAAVADDTDRSILDGLGLVTLAPGPYDRSAAVAQLKAAKIGHRHWGWTFLAPPFSARPAVEEARFWLVALGDRQAETPGQAASTATHFDAEALSRSNGPSNWLVTRTSSGAKPWRCCSPSPIPSPCSIGCSSLFPKPAIRSSAAAGTRPVAWCASWRQPSTAPI